MLQSIRKFLSRLFVFLTIVVCSAPAFGASANFLPDVGDAGSYATENNKAIFTAQLSDDVEQFSGEFQKQLVADYVPIEAKVGIAFMNAMSLVANAIDAALGRFIIVFIIVMYAFWIMFETYKMMTDGDGKIKELLMSIVKKGFLIIVWSIVLSFGPAQIFMWIMGPIIGVGSYLADLILNSVAQSSGAYLPDTCAAIREYAASHTSARGLIDSDSVANILCLPTRLSGFCYTAIAAGWQWMLAGIGRSVFTFMGGAIFIVAFIMIAWKFAFMALGVVADLFLGIIMLPFTAIKETVGNTNYKGIAGNIFNSFLGIFAPESLSTQIQRFINASIYYVSLSVVIAFCAALLSGVVKSDLAGNVPTLQGADFWTTLLVALLTWWFASRAGKIATDLGGSIDTKVGDQMRDDISTFWKKTTGAVRDWVDAFKKSK